jgi:small nuclear ribonucleoprotein F
VRIHRVNEEVVIRLKWGQTEYKGRLVSIDSYMNIQLSGAEEYIDQQMTSALGQVLIRYVEILLKSNGIVFMIEGLLESL